MVSNNKDMFFACYCGYIALAKRVFLNSMKISSHLRLRISPSNSCSQETVVNDERTTQPLGTSRLSSQKALVAA